MKRKPKLNIKDESELTRVVVCKTRAYVVPKDVADTLEQVQNNLAVLRVAIAKVCDWLDKMAGIAKDNAADTDFPWLAKIDRADAKIYAGMAKELRAAIAARR